MRTFCSASLEIDMAILLQRCKREDVSRALVLDRVGGGVGWGAVHRRTMVLLRFGRDFFQRRWDFNTTKLKHQSRFNSHPYSSLQLILKTHERPMTTPLSCIYTTDRSQDATCLSMCSPILIQVRFFLASALSTRRTSGIEVIQLGQYTAYSLSRPARQCRIQIPQTM